MWDRRSGTFKPLIQSQRQPVFAGMTGTVTHIVVTLAVAVKNLVGPQAILGPYLVVMVPQGHWAGATSGARPSPSGWLNGGYFGRTPALTGAIHGCWPAWFPWHCLLRASEQMTAPEGWDGIVAVVALGGQVEQNLERIR